MKCKICGKNFDGNGDICENCKNEDMQGSFKSFQIKRKYSIKYNFLKYWYWIIVFLASGAMTGKKSAMIYSILCMILLFAIILIIDKRMAKATKCKFLKNHIEYQFKIGNIDRNRKLKYKNIDSIFKEQTLSQKLCDFGTICIYADKGNLLTTGIQIKNVSNFKENYEKIKQTIENNMQ